MSNRKLAKAIQGLFRAIKRLHYTVTKGLVNWLLRSALKNNRGNRLASGFVLPTTVLLVLVVALTVGALTYRAYNRNAQVIGQNQQRIIYNAATPAIDRARSKLEFLFDATKDNRYPGGVPGEDRLLAMLLNDGKDATNTNVFAKLPTTEAGVLIDPYKLLDEDRVDLNGDGRKDNAWSFRTDTDANGTPDATVIYSIIFSNPTDAVKNPQELLLTLSDKQKAQQLLVRHGPLSKESNAVKCGSGSGGAEGGWFEDRGGNTSILRKNFQVDAMVIPDQATSTAVTLEFHQDRQLNRGNKWGAWFRNDLEIFPGPAFNWNGAMHTEGSLILGGDQITAHLISAPSSCLFSPADNSGITVTDVSPAFKGNIIAGKMADNNTSGSATIYRYGTTPQPFTLNSSSDSTNGGFGPYDVSLDPTTVLVEDGYKYRSDKLAGSTDNWTNLKNPGLAERVTSKSQDKPYVDDLYRADDRWGPKPKYGTGDTARVVPAGDMGKEIPSTSDNLILTLKDDDAPGSAGSAVGLDGYWERRARGKGLRILVGERLELGNLNTWVTPRDTNADSFITKEPTPSAPGAIGASDEREGDPLYPPTIAPYPIDKTESLKHLDLQRRTLRDNLSAVQATAVYHSIKDKDYPVACLTSTVHPGNLSSLYQSINFKPTQFADGASGAVGAVNPPLQSNFFTGQGTNGWEFSAPSGTAAQFETAMNSATSPLRTALQNLANFAGDPDGVFPLAPTDTTVVHPYPALSMWGNYSNLRRVLGKLTAGTAYTDLSIADKTYLQTASCTIGVLAYNIDTIQKFDPTNVNNDYDFTGSNSFVLTELAKAIQLLMNGDESDGEVLPKGQLGSRDYDPNSNRTGINGGLNKDTDYADVPPEAWIGALKQKLLKNQYLGSSATYQEALASTLNDSRVRMAELIMLKYQIRRDRAFGFRSSPAFGTYVGQAAGTGKDTTRTKYRLPSACDPDDFTFTPSPGLITNVPGKTGGPTIGSPGVKEGEYRLALSRLCGALDTTNYDPDDVTKRAWVLPKFPALYYIFPETNHDLDGALDIAGTGIYDHRQPGLSTLKTDIQSAPATIIASTPVIDQANSIAKSDSRAITDKEPYVTNTYVSKASVNGSATFKVVGTSAIPVTPVSLPTLLPPTPTLAAASGNTPSPSRYPYLVTSPFPVADYALGSSIALTPRSLTANEWQLPHTTPKTVSTAPVSGGPNVSPNIIVSTDGTKVAVPFLDRAISDGRQNMLMRSLDIDLGMLRSNGIGTDVWLPESGIVYAFREDAVREDAIVRPTGTNTDLRNPAKPTDPAFVSGISPKAVDYLPDPERRTHGFRLRNGSEIKRKDSLLEAARNIRGLSFFTDQPVFIQGDFNLHQDGGEDTAGTRLEEFVETLPDTTAYSAAQFYGRKTTNYDNFSSPLKDRWRPSEILADSIGILSNNFCDGSIADMFVIPDLNKANVPDFKLFPSDDFNPSSSPRAQYNDSSKSGLFSPGCISTGYTSFHNRNLPRKVLPNNWDWVRENSSNATLPQQNTTAALDYWADFTSPIKISRAGQPLIQAPQASAGALTTQPALPRSVLYATRFPTEPYFDIGQNNDGGRRLIPAIQTRVNSIVVSGIVPSRKSQSYGGLHNFPRFLEDWGSKPLNFTGSFLQLSFSNYGTAPFESEAWEICQSVDSSNENLNYYSPPLRLWGYDVGLQLSPAGPAATRFVTSSKSRNEFYNEPPVNDPYINLLCKAAKTITNPNFGPKDTAKVNCPS